jgi:hypothetical protein
LNEFVSNAGSAELQFGNGAEGSTVLLRQQKVAIAVVEGYWAKALIFLCYPQTPD